MKKIISIFILLACIFFTFLCTSCSNIYERIVIDNTESYQKIWSYPERRSECAVFPEDVNNLNVKNLYCDYNVYFPLGTGYEILLSIQYEENTFAKEIERLSNLSFERNIIFDNNSFIYPAYVATLGYNYSNEYVLVDEDTCTLHYIYLQETNIEDIEIPIEYLPEKYDLGKVEEFRYSIYANDIENQYGY